MIYGIGIDMVEIARIEESLRQGGQRFIDRIAHPADLEGEPQTEMKRAEYWASRFAVKEAFSKALGTGIGATVSFSCVGVEKSRGGKPFLTFTESLTAKLAELGIVHSHVSITHTATSATAVVILEGSSQ